MKPETQTLLVHVGCVALLALCVWLSTLIKGDSEYALEARALLIGAAAMLWGKLGFRPANPVLDRILTKLVQREPERVARLTNNPPPPAATPLRAPDGHVIGYVPAKDMPEDEEPWR